MSTILLLVLPNTKQNRIIIPKDQHFKTCSSIFAFKRLTMTYVCKPRKTNFESVTETRTQTLKRGIKTVYG